MFNFSWIIPLRLHWSFLRCDLWIFWRLSGSGESAEEYIMEHVLAAEKSLYPHSLLRPTLLSALHTNTLAHKNTYSGHPAALMQPDTWQDTTKHTASPRAIRTKSTADSDSGSQRRPSCCWKGRKKAACIERQTWISRTRPDTQTPADSSHQWASSQRVSGN